MERISIINITTYVLTLFENIKNKMLLTNNTAEEIIIIIKVLGKENISTSFKVKNVDIIKITDKM